MTGASRGVGRGVAVAAAILAVAGCAPTVATSALADQAPLHGSASPSWHIVKRVPTGPDGGFTEVTAVGKHGGRAFDAGPVPTAWERDGSTWTQIPFPGLSSEVVVAAGGTSATDSAPFGCGRSVSYWYKPVAGLLARR